MHITPFGYTQILTMNSRRWNLCIAQENLSVAWTIRCSTNIESSLLQMNNNIDRPRYLFYRDAWIVVFQLSLALLGPRWRSTVKYFDCNATGRPTEIYMIIISSCVTLRVLFAFSFRRRFTLLCTGDMPIIIKRVHGNFLWLCYFSAVLRQFKYLIIWFKKLVNHVYGTVMYLQATVRGIIAYRRVYTYNICVLCMYYIDLIV